PKPARRQRRARPASASAPPREGGAMNPAQMPTPMVARARTVISTIARLRRGECRSRKQAARGAGKSRLVRAGDRHFLRIVQLHEVAVRRAAIGGVVVLD